MRLWHQDLIPYLPRQQLLGQHRECCALRGKGWGKKHSVVDYVFKYSPDWLVAYHYHVMKEMENRGYHPDKIWANPCWRGNILGEEPGWSDKDIVNHIGLTYEVLHKPLYPEHNDEYLKECLENLKNKDIVIEAFKDLY